VVTVLVLETVVLEGDTVAELPAHHGHETVQDAPTGVDVAVADDTNRVGVNDCWVLGVVLDSKHCVHNGPADF
jgi:hypothetical protein